MSIILPRLPQEISEDVAQHKMPLIKPLWEAWRLYPREKDIVWQCCADIDPYLSDPLTQSAKIYQFSAAEIQE